MNRKLLTLVVLVLGVSLLTSCFDDDDEYVYTDDSAIALFSLGTLNQDIHTTSSKGLDSVYRKTLDCSGYKFYIDQVKGEIYNPDSLPYGIDDKKVICSVYAKNAGVIAIKSMTSDSLSYFQNTDSIDFSSPRVFCVYSNSGAGNRKYTVRVNVHKEQADTFRWKSMGRSTVLAELKGMKAVALKDRLFVFGTDGSRTLAYTSADGVAWTDLTGNFAGQLAADAYRSVVKKGSSMYIYNNGSVERSDDGTSWSVTGTAALRQLVAASDIRLYAYDAGGRFVESADDGATWTPAVIDESEDLLPTEDLSYVCVPVVTNKYTYRVLLVGNRDYTACASDTTAHVWGKVDEELPNSENQPWTYYDVAEENRYKAPRLRNLQTTAYDDAVIAIGGESLGGAERDAFDRVYRSADGGITWKRDSVISIPNGLRADASSFAFVSDSNNFVWLICGGSGQVWRGRTNRLGWIKEQDSFTE